MASLAGLRSRRSRCPTRPGRRPVHIRTKKIKNFEIIPELIFDRFFDHSSFDHLNPLVAFEILFVLHYL